MDPKDAKDISEIKSLIKQRNETPEKRAEINPKIREKLASASNYTLSIITTVAENQLAEKELLSRLKRQKFNNLNELFTLLENGIFHELVWNEIKRVSQTAPQKDIINIIREFVGTCFLGDHPAFAKAISDRTDINEIIAKIKDIKKGSSDTSVIIDDLRFKRWE